jgi:hypothetical protein
MHACLLSGLLHLGVTMTVRGTGCRSGLIAWFPSERSCHLRPCAFQRLKQKQLFGSGRRYPDAGKARRLERLRRRCKTLHTSEINSLEGEAS